MWGPIVLVFALAGGIIYIASQRGIVRAKNFNMTATLDRVGDMVVVNTTVTGQLAGGPVNVFEYFYRNNSRIVGPANKIGKVRGVHFEKVWVGKLGGNVSVYASDNVSSDRIDLQYYDSRFSPRFNLSG